MKKIITPDIKIISIPLISIILVILITISILKPTYAKIQKSVNDYKSAVSMENLLQEKLNSLKIVEKGVLDKTDISLLALPNKNPSPWVISQLKNNAGQELIIDEITLSSFHEEKTDRVEINLNITAPSLDSIVGFLTYLKEIAPLILINNYNIEKSNELMEMTIGMSVYFADLPAVLPAITQPIEGLTQRQEDILSMISKLKKPEFNILEPLQPTERSTPFN